MIASNWIELAALLLGIATFAAAGLGVHLNIRDALAELKGGFSGVVKLLEKQDERITYLERKPAPKAARRTRK